MNSKYIILILILLGVIAFQYKVIISGNPKNYPTVDTMYIVDTFWKPHDTTIYKKVVLKEIIHDTVPAAYMPEPMYESLKEQYLELANAYLAKKVYQDTLHIPNIKGMFVITDTIKNNTLLGRSWTSKYSIPTVKETVTIIKPVPIKNQLYIGGGITTQLTRFESVNIGLMLKTKQDKLVGVQIGYNGQIIYGVNTYWKINLHK